MKNNNNNNVSKCILVILALVIGVIGLWRFKKMTGNGDDIVTKYFKRIQETEETLWENGKN